MTQDIAIKDAGNLGGLLDIETDDFVTFIVDEQLLGIPVLQVSDILKIENIAPVPLAPAQVKGSINLRGRIVTVIDVRTCLGIPPKSDGSNDLSEQMGVTIELGHDLFTLLVDQVGEVIGVSAEQREPVPQTLDQNLREVALNIYRLEDKLLIVLDPEKLIKV